MPCQAFDELVSPLRELLSILEAESVALKSLDFAGIDAATAAKDGLAERLAAAVAESGDALSEAQRQEVVTLREDVSALAKANHLRLRATLQTVEGIVSAMTGGTRTTYGRNAQAANTAPRAVLMAEVG